MDDLLHASAWQQAHAVQTGLIDRDQLLATQRRAIDQLNPEINCYIGLTTDRLLPSDPPPHSSSLWGSTFAIKDNIDLQGWVTHAGLKAFGSAVPAATDAPVVAKLKAAGLHCLGRLNMHPLALGASNHNPDFGNCLNPARPGYSPGGSSGGSGAAVAAGLCGIALGTDTMGSVRLPAAYCGAVGFKPSHGLLGLDGVVPLSRLLDHVGVLARSVKDVQEAMAILSPIPLSGHPTGPFALEGVSLAVVRDVHTLGASPEVVLAYEHGLDRLRNMGGLQWSNTWLDPNELGLARRSGLLLCEAELFPLLAPLVRDQPEALPSDLLAMMRYVEKKSAVDIGRALNGAGLAAAYLDRLLHGADVLILPTAPQTAFDMGTAPPHNQADLTALANMNGAPAISLPLPVGPHDLPVGLQLIGRRGCDGLLLKVAQIITEHPAWQ